MTTKRTPDVRVTFRSNAAMIRAYYFMCGLADDAGKKPLSYNMEEGWFGKSIRLSPTNDVSIDRDAVLIAWKKRGYRMIQELL